MSSAASPFAAHTWRLLFTAWVLALAATLGALFIGEVLGLTPCILCWYQRICMFPLAIILFVAALRIDAAVWRYALPLSVIGTLIAAYHTAEISGIVPTALTPCTATGPSCTGASMKILGVVPIPLLAFTAFAAITTLLVLLRQGERS